SAAGLAACQKGFEQVLHAGPQLTGPLLHELVPRHAEYFEVHVSLTPGERFHLLYKLGDPVLLKLLNKRVKFVLRAGADPLRPRAGADRLLWLLPPAAQNAAD